jgi:hypothetical protein
MSAIKGAKNNSKVLKEESKKMNQKLIQLRELMDLDVDKKKINGKFSKGSSNWNAGSNINSK